MDLAHGCWIREHAPGQTGRHFLSATVLVNEFDPDDKRYLVTN
jgi:hypothetical protein